MFSAIGAALLGIVKSNAFATLIMSVGGWLIKKQHDKAIKDKDSTYTTRMEYVAMAKPYIVSAIKLAEAKIPDDTPNKALAKADLAFKVLAQMLTKDNIQTIPMLLKQSIVEIHKELDLAGKLEYMFSEKDEEVNED